MPLPIRAALALSLAVVLAGCLGLTGALSGVPVLSEARLANGAVTLKPPAGYCIDARSLSDRPGGGFALIGSCASLTGAATGVLAEPAIITVSTSPATDRDISTDSRAFQTALGRGRILRAINRDDGLSLLHVEGGARVPPSADPRHWRGLMLVQGQLLGLALYAGQDSPMTGDAGLRLMVELADAIRTDSGTAAAATVASRPPDDAE
jgi:hypothetical protein